MSKKMKRILSLLLTLALVLGLLPGNAQAAGIVKSKDKLNAGKVYTEAENALLENDVFAAISAVTAQSDTAQVMGGVSQMTEADYITILPEVIEAIENSETYAAGTLQQNGRHVLIASARLQVPFPS